MQESYTRPVKDHERVVTVGPFQSLGRLNGLRIFLMSQYS